MEVAGALIFPSHSIPYKILNTSVDSPFIKMCENIQSSEGPTSSPNVFTPFGGGPRRCPGYELARVELSVFLHHLVTRFRYAM